MAEYGRYERVTPVVRFINDILLSAPSIIIGLFVYELVVVPMGGFSALAGGVALAVIVVPVVVRTTEDMLLLVPNQLREAAASIGAPRSVIIRSVCYKAAQAGIVTGILLAIARVSGETAPLLFTALGQPQFQPRPHQPDGEPAAHHQSIRIERLSGVAVARLDGCLDHHGRGLAAQHHRARARVEEERPMSVSASSAPMLTVIAPSGAARSRRRPPPPTRDKIRIENLNFFYGQNQGAQGHLPLAARKRGHGLHRPVGLREIDACCGS